MSETRIRKTQSWLPALLIAAVYFYCPTAMAQPYAVKPGVNLEAGGSVINLRAAWPLVMDWDNDSKKDLVLGWWPPGTWGDTHGEVRIYKNVGTDAAPRFVGYEEIDETDIFSAN